MTDRPVDQESLETSFGSKDQISSVRSPRTDHHGRVQLGAMKAGGGGPLQLVQVSKLCKEDSSCSSAQREGNGLCHGSMYVSSQFGIIESVSWLVGKEQ